MTLVHQLLGPPTATRALLLVHGFGANEQDLGQLLLYLDPEGRFLAILPRGPISVPGTPGFAWFELGALASDSTLVPEGYIEALDALDDLLDEVCRERGFQRSEAVVGGFSQGAAAAVGLAYRASARDTVAGCLALSGFFVDGEGLTYDWERARAIPAMVQHGTLDPVVPVERGRALAETLQSHGTPTVYAEFPMQHQIALESLQKGHEWLLALQAGEQPNEPIGPFEEPVVPLVREITTAQWGSEVMQSPLPVIVDFWAPWCGPCRQVSPIVEQIAAMREGAYTVVKVNIDEEPAIAQQYDVQSIPMIAMFRDGRLVAKSLGAKPRQQIEAELGMLVIP